MLSVRSSGLLLHPTSLPGRFGIGDLGDQAFKFVDFLHAAGQTWWQILPLGPTGQGNSPYSSFSAFAGNPLVISPEGLVRDGLLGNSDLTTLTAISRNTIDFRSVSIWKRQLITAAYSRFCSHGTEDLAKDFDTFSRENSWWLDDYALFVVLKESHDQKPWYEWGEPLRLRERSAVDGARSQFARHIDVERFTQFLFFRQWVALKRYANKANVLIMGDLPIFVALDSADVWCNQSQFKLNPDCSPAVVAGVPPDHFSKTGQLWGNPIYDWEAMMADDFGWWTARVAHCFRTANALRLDHFIGFVRNWEIPGGSDTAEHGAWRNVPGRELFLTLKRRLGNLPLIAEDLGSVTPEVEELRDSFGFAGMKILQYAFGGDANNRDLPHNFIRNSVVYTGTHDNDTIVGWYKTVPKAVKDHLKKYLSAPAREVHWDMIRAAMASVANTAIIPVQDLLGLGSDARMNVPATESGNWEWRLNDGELNNEIGDRLLDLSRLYGRTDHG